MGVPAGIEPQDYYLPDNMCEECGAWAETIEDGLCPECFSEKLEEERFEAIVRQLRDDKGFSL